MMVLKNYEFAAQYKEELIEDELFFNAYWISAVWKVLRSFYDAKEAKYKDDDEVFRN
jgi:hypothetical protein